MVRTQVILLGMATRWERRAGRAARGLCCRGCLLAAVLAVCAAGCTAQGPLRSGNSVKRHVNSLGCYIGTFRLRVSPTHERPGQTVTLAANGPRAPSGGVGTESWGLLGTAPGGHFAAIYNLAAIAPGVQHQHNIPAGSSGGLAGVGLPNRPFRVQVPPVPSGSYIIQFAYSVDPGSMGNAGSGPKTYTLCARLRVDS